MTITSNRELVDDLIERRLVHEIHTSERRSFRGCRRRWNWIFNEMYYPLVTAKPLEFGIAYHAAMEVFYDPETWKWPHHVKVASAKAEFAQVCEKQRAKYLEVNDETFITNDEVQTDYDERVELGLGMLEYNLNVVSPKIDHGWTPKRVEVEFIVPIQDPDTFSYLFCTCDKCWKLWCRDQDTAEGGLPWDDPRSAPLADMRRTIWPGLPVVLAGRIDMLAQDQYGDLWIFDWKTARSISVDRDEFLYLDDQIGSYVMALRRKLGLNVRGFIYHEQRKGFPKPPQRNKVIRLGRAFSINTNQEVDYESYLETIKEEDTAAYEAGLYDEFLNFLEHEGTIFYKRFQLHLTDTQLENIERQLFIEASDMVDPNLRIYPNAGRFNCAFCAFRQPCMGMTAGEDYQFALDTMYEKRDKPYWVKQLSTESQGGE